MTLIFDSNNSSRLAAQVILILLALTVSTSCLCAQGSAPKPPGEVLREFRKMDEEGGRLTTEGWYRAASFFVKPAPLPRYRILHVIKDEEIDAHPPITGSRSQVWTSYDKVGQIDAEGRFTSLVVPSLLDASGQLRKRPWGDESYGPAQYRTPYDLVLTEGHWEFTPDHNELREVGGDPQWRIVGEWRTPMVTVQTAIRYLTRLHDESSSSVIKRNAKKSIADIQRLVNREKSNAKP
jgi:hypothetical protein